jgi:prepilin-type N-terminal cleavage/methylation domain-containing protein/prepilin-type processing-associated H-X9-DG protein
MMKSGIKGGKNNSLYSCCKGFTLVELLVVISIIALLLSIMMPALQKAREGGRRVMCGSNEKQIAMSFIMYSMNYNDYIVQDRGIRINPATGTVVKYELGADQATRPWDSALSSVWRTKGTDAFKKYIICPSDNYLRGDPPVSTWYKGGGYLHRSYAPNGTLYNGIWSYFPKVLWGNRTGVPAKATKVWSPQRVMLIGECHKGKNWNNNGDLYGNVQGTNRWEALGTNGQCEVYWALRAGTPVVSKEWNTTHLQGANFAFIDGHVKWHVAAKGQDYVLGMPFKDMQYPLQWQWSK